MTEPETFTFYALELILHGQPCGQYYNPLYGWTDPRNVIEYETDQALMNDLLRDGDRGIKYLMEGEIKKITKASVPSDFASINKRGLHFIKVASEINDIISSSQYEEKLDDEDVINAYVGYHRRGGPSKNKYHIAALFNDYKVRKFVETFSDKERFELFGTTHCGYYGEIQKLISLLLKPLGIRYPEVNYAPNIVLFQNKATAIRFKLQYGFEFEVIDFSEIYNSYFEGTASV
jgi:hypothetical protein